ncbi:preprotein translocase subunit YajC [Lactobacillus xylocopicola]|uniref:Preprotein translocase subunit YajC n=1 Tax=Lactobacillus xylocopicola TaxID=2976676 RepID=A0ABN6SM89_9LACO|nr:preprotein translocase subunit YajC [Lactobacillus xylocopicola]BDR60793.1 preprotein translocase subunit YajC [Lactobacillus xylocopicola]
MNTLFLAANTGMNSIWTIVIFAVVIGLMYFTMIKPQKKQQQQKMEMMNELKKGDHVVMIDGLHGKIDAVNTEDKTVVVDADGIYLTFNRMAVQQIIPAASSEPVEAEPAKEAKPAEPAKKPTKDQANDSKDDSAE